MSTSPESKILYQRAAMLRAVREFFFQKKVLEVDCLALSPASPVDLHIDVIETDSGYLHTSPEYRMKELLSLGSGDIYQLGHVFRKEERGPWHLPEFTMIEWYRTQLDFEGMIEETLECIALFLPELKAQRLTYKELFLKYLEVNCMQATSEELYQIALSQGVLLDASAKDWDRDTLLQLLLGTCIEPQLGNDHLFVLTQFPASQAALSKTVGDEALRFEIYYKGIELANGYQELTDATEQRARFKQANKKRQKAGKVELPIDESFLRALERGLPECTGVAVGFDRLLQLQCSTRSITELYPGSSYLL